MRKPLVVTTLVVAAIFATGYIVGEGRGISIGSAAGSTPTQPPSASQPSEDPGHADVPHAGGHVTAVSGNTVTVQPGTQGWRHADSLVTTIILTASTQYRVPPVNGSATTTGKAAVTVGSYMIAQGTLSADSKTLTAASVVILPKGFASHGFGHFGPHADGQVTAKGANALTIKPDTNEPSHQDASVTTIILSSSTQYFAGRGVSSSKDAITVGSYVFATGTLSADGKTLTATRVMLRSGMGPEGGPEGAPAGMAAPPNA